MSVFDANVLTPRAVPDPGTDSTLPDPGSLSYASITSNSALSSTNGVDALLVHGDRDRTVNGNEATRIAINRTHTVGGNQSKKIAGNKNENIVGNFVHTTIGNLHRSIIGATNDLYTAAHSIQHKASQLAQEPVSWMHDVTDGLMKFQAKHDEYGFYQLYAGLVNNFIITNVDMKGVQLAAIRTLAELHGICHAEKAIDNKISALENRADAMDARVGAIQPVLHVTMLHEVAITQKILVVGVNQFM